MTLAKNRLKYFCTFVTISDELSCTLFTFSLRRLGAELQGVGGGFPTLPPPSSGGGKSRGQSGCGLKKNKLFLGGLNMDHNLSKITAAARCRPNKPPARRSICEKGHLGSFGKRSCVLLPARFLMTPAPDGSKELSLHISCFNVRTFFFPLTFRGIFWGNCEKRDRQ